MTINEVYENLCFYDERNPNSANAFERQLHKDIMTQKNCLCDNCLNGRTILAEEILLIYHIQTS